MISALALELAIGLITSGSVALLLVRLWVFAKNLIS